MFEGIVEFIRNYYHQPQGFIGLHEPRFVGNERKYVLEAIDSTFVSSVGPFVDRFESMMREYTGSSYAIATVNGTAALHMSLLLAGVERNDLVITQALTFIATCNAISYIGAEPLLIDIDKKTLGLSAEKLKVFLKKNARIKNNECFHHPSGRRIAACVPMHTFGHPVQLTEIVDLCREYGVPLIEDAAESMGSKYHGKQTGTFGLLGAFSFNGNKTITCGGGGAIITQDERIGKLAKHLTTQAKIPHPWEFAHDQVGYNNRLPNLNAAMACAQMEMLDKFVDNKRNLAKQYKKFFETTNLTFIDEPEGAFSNFWLNAILFKDRPERDAFLQYSNDKKVMTRPVWRLMSKLEMFKKCISGDLENALETEDRLVNLPSSVLI